MSLFGFSGSLSFLGVVVLEGVDGRLEGTNRWGELKTRGPLGGFYLRGIRERDVLARWRADDFLTGRGGFGGCVGVLVLFSTTRFWRGGRRGEHRGP